MAQIEISIRRDNGTTIAANATVDDTLVADMAMTLTALLFDSATVEPAPEPAAPAPVAQRAQPKPEPQPVVDDNPSVTGKQLK